MTSTVGKVHPNLLVVGTARAGTTSPYYWIKQHLELFMPDLTEPSFFVEGFGVMSQERSRVDSHDFRVSVVITSYNQKQYLIEAIESVMRQTVKPHEIIIADDHSSDGSVEVIQAYMHDNPGWIKGVFQSSNVDVAKNRNAGLEQATGDWVAILDGDDRYLPRNLELQIKALANHPGAGCVYTNLYFIDAEGNRTRIRDSVLQPSGDIFTSLANVKMGHMRSMIARLDLVRTVGCMDERHPRHNDEILLLRLAKLTEFAYVFEPLAEYRVHRDGYSKRVTFAERTPYLKNWHSEILLLSQDLPSQVIQRIERSWSWRMRRLQVLTAFEERKRAKALILMVWAFIRNPRRWQELRRLRQTFSEKRGEHLSQ